MTTPIRVRSPKGQRGLCWRQDVVTFAHCALPKGHEPPCSWARVPVEGVTQFVAEHLRAKAKKERA